MSRHPLEQDLALYAAGDLRGWARLRTALHVRQCGECGVVVEAFRGDRLDLEDGLRDLPPHLQWERLEAEMTANIRLGLAAGQCVAAETPEPPPFAAGWNWRPAAVVAAVAMVFCAAWWLNMPPITIGHGQPATVVAASTDGVEIREKSGVGLSLRPGDADADYEPADIRTKMAEPAMFDPKFSGALSARYVGDEGVTETTMWVVKR